MLKEKAAMQAEWSDLKGEQRGGNEYLGPVQVKDGQPRGLLLHLWDLLIWVAGHRTDAPFTQIDILHRQDT